MWKRIVASVDDLISALAIELPDVAHELEHFSTPVFPLRGIVSFSRPGLPERSHVILTIDYRSSDEGMRITAEVTGGHQGPMLAGLQYAVAESSRIRDGQLWRTADAVASFIEDSAEVIRAALADEP
ncbi:MAG TPA: hypothetical protein VM618_01855 [Acidimicrobiia bacterium]|nr:hypothetical protein [Acidimicrobiia bacterium]